MTALKNHPAFWLNPAAAAALARFEAAHGVIPINSAGRTQAQQQALIDRWDKGGPMNRPPYLFAPARPANASRHVVNGGEAIDTEGNGITLMHKYGQDFGFYFNFAYDKVHFEYEESRDKSKTATQRATIKVGSRGNDVADLQKILNKYHGAKLKVDGVYGGGTANAVGKAQKKLGIPADKIVGPITWKKLGQ